MIYFACLEKEFSKEIEYAMEHLFRVMNVDWRLTEPEKAKLLGSSDYLIIYGDVPSQLNDNTFLCPVLFIQNSHLLFGRKFGKKESMPDMPHVTDEFVSLYRSSSKENMTDTNIEILPYDIVADVFFMITRYEEYSEINPVGRDGFGRFSATVSLAYRYGFLNRPVVDEWALYIKKKFDKSGCSYTEQTINRQAKLFVTHDVDSLRKYKCQEDVMRGLFRGEISWWKLCLGIDPNNNIVQLARWEKMNQIKSDFYFLPRLGENDADYDIKDISVQSQMRKIGSMEGHEVGYHGSFWTMNDLDKHKEEIQRLKCALTNQVSVRGARQHYLKCTVPDTFSSLEEEGICYDTTLAFADMEGFRCGTSHPFPLYDVRERRALKIWEIPLIFMDVTLKNYQRYSISRLEEIWNQYEDTIRSCKGVFTILWHNNRFSEESFRSYNSFYASRIISMAKTMKSCTGMEIIEEYRRRAYDSRC